MKIALFGGAFDPPHLGHVHVATTLLTTHIVDEVWYVPVRQHPFSKALQATDAQRLAMVQMVVADKVRVETYELDSLHVSYAYYTLQAMAAQHPDHTFSWVIGSDNVASFPKWKSYQQLLNEFTVYVYPRTNYPMEPLLPGMVGLTEMEAVAISSTQVRERVQKGQAITDIVGEKIAAYIAEQGLYQ